MVTPNPDSGNTLLRQVTIRVEEHRLREWKISAAWRGQSLSEWMRVVLDAEAKHYRRGGLPREVEADILRQDTQEGS